MSDFPETVDSLIVRVQDPSDQSAWNQFEQLYRPVIFRIARAKGLQHADALDLTQQVLISVASAIERYEKRDDEIRFRNWIGRITRNAILKALSRGPRDRASGGTDVLDALQNVPSSDDETDALIENEYRREVYSRAASVVRQEVAEATWLAFEMTVLQGKSIDHATSAIGISAGSVYAARSRVIRRLRDFVRQLECDVDQEHDKE